MPFEILQADTLISQTNSTGTLADIDESPDFPDANFLTATANNTSTVAQLGFPTPTAPLTVGADLQIFRVYVEQFDEAQSGTPTAHIELWENGSLIRAGVETDVTVGGVILVFSWNANELVDPTGAGVEIEIITTFAGGPPSARNSVNVGAVEWIADYTVATGGEIKYWDGGAWVLKPVKYWDGGAWTTKPLKRWDGGAWVST